MLRKPAELCRSIVGRMVRLVRDIHTRGGQKFSKGTLMHCYGTWRGRFHLEGERSADVGRPHIRQVSRADFELVEEYDRGIPVLTLHAEREIERAMQSAGKSSRGGTEAQS